MSMWSSVDFDIETEVDVATAVSLHQLIRVWPEHYDRPFTLTTDQAQTLAENLYEAIRRINARK